MQPRCIVAMEVGSGSHYWGRLFQEYGHEVRLIPAAYVKPYVKSQKNDRADAEAIAEAAQRPNMRFVAVKRVEQQDLQNIHRVRERYGGYLFMERELPCGAPLRNKMTEACGLQR